MPDKYSNFRKQYFIVYKHLQGIIIFVFFCQIYFDSSLSLKLYD